MRLFLILLFVLLVRPAAAQRIVPPARPAKASAFATVHGYVSDSVATAPLVGAIVQLVDADSLSRFNQTAVSDSLGGFTFGDVPNGRYTIGFFHPMLDSLGLDPILRSVTVNGQSTLRTDLAIPGPARIRSAICGPPSAINSGGVVMGFVRDARSRAPSAGVTVIGEWIELSFGTNGVSRRVPRRVVTSKESGWFAVCNTPGPGTMTLMASHNADSTDIIELAVPATGFLRRDMYLGATRTVTVVDSTPRTDSVARAPRRVRVGDGRLSGTVVTSLGERPLAGAQVSIANGPQTRANARGEWTIADAPPGTRALEVRAVGYYPARLSVDVVDAIPNIRVALVTFKSVLETVKVTANYDRYTNLAGFRERSRTGMGRYVTADDIARRQPLATTDLFRNVAGVFLEGYALDTKLSMRGTFTDRCDPAIYLNSNLMPGVTGSDIDDLVKPKELIGIEVYSPTNVPPQFQPGLSGCGSIVIWTK